MKNKEEIITSDTVPDINTVIEKPKSERFENCYFNEELKLGQKYGE